MKATVILFEDQRVPCFRPLAWSTPLYELRCGLFNSRERVERVLAALELEPVLGALCRPLLAPLNQASQWLGAAGLGQGGDGPALWLNARLGAHPRLLEALVQEMLVGEEFSLWWQGDLVAAAVNPERNAEMLGEWRAWSAAEPWRGPAAGSVAWPPAGALPQREPAVDLAALGGGGPLLLQWIWDLVPAAAPALAADLALAAEAVWRRTPFGLVPDPAASPAAWQGECRLARGGLEATVVGDAAALWSGPGSRALPGLVVDTRSGPVIVDRDVEIEAHVFLQGPLYLGPGCRVKAGARLYGESSFGIGCRLAGEIGESVFGDFCNKQHEGFIGHAVLGSWINLGALTTCSDLKNNYGPVRVNLGDGEVDTGLRFVGLMMGDHAKTAIGTLLNTGTCVGFASNLFGTGMPPKLVDNFRWGGHDPAAGYEVARALTTARVVMARRDCLLTADHERLFRALA